MQKMAMQMHCNLIVGLNAALQRRMVCGEVCIGDVNRASHASVGVGGKGQNVLLASSCMLLKGIPLKLLQFIGGGCEGDIVMSLLSRLPADLVTVRTSGRCRTCVTIIEEAHLRSTEFIEPSESISPEDWSDLLGRASSMRAAGLAAMGSLPPGLLQSTYAEIISRSCDATSKVVLDTTAGLLEAIGACVSVGCQALVKINTFELGKLSMGAGASIAEQCHKLLDQAGCTHAAHRVHFAITDGPRPIHLVSSSGTCLTMRLLTDVKVVNPIGAGDTVAAGVLQCWTNNLQADASLMDALRSKMQVLPSEEERDVGVAVAWGMACGAASCAKVENAMFDLALAVEYVHCVEIGVKKQPTLQVELL